MERWLLLDFVDDCFHGGGVTEVELENRWRVSATEACAYSVPSCSFEGDDDLAAKETCRSSDEYSLVHDGWGGG